MQADKRMPVTESVSMDLCSLKRAGQTYSQLLEEVIEERKKAKLFHDREEIEDSQAESFGEIFLSFDQADYDDHR